MKIPKKFLSADEKLAEEAYAKKESEHDERVENYVSNLIDSQLSLNSYFDFFSPEAFKVAEMSRLVAYAQTQNLGNSLQIEGVGTEMILFAYHYCKLPVFDLLEKYWNKKHRKEIAGLTKKEQKDYFFRALFSTWYVEKEEEIERLEKVKNQYFELTKEKLNPREIWQADSEFSDYSFILNKRFSQKEKQQKKDAKRYETNKFLNTLSSFIENTDESFTPAKKREPFIIKRNKKEEYYSTVKSCLSPERTHEEQYKRLILLIFLMDQTVPLETRREVYQFIFDSMINHQIRKVKDKLERKVATRADREQIEFLVKKKNKALEAFQEGNEVSFGVQNYCLDWLRAQFDPNFVLEEPQFEDPEFIENIDQIQKNLNPTSLQFLLEESLILLEDLPKEENLQEDILNILNNETENPDFEDLFLKTLASENFSFENLSVENLASENLSFENLSLENLSFKKVSSESIPSENIPSENIPQNEADQGKLGFLSSKLHQKLTWVMKKGTILFTKIEKKLHQLDRHIERSIYDKDQEFFPRSIRKMGFSFIDKGKRIGSKIITSTIGRVFSFKPNLQIKLLFNREATYFFDKCVENAVTRFRSPVLTSESLLVTLLEEKKTKGGALLNRVFRTKTDFHLFRYQLLKTMHYQELEFQKQVVLEQRYYGYLLKTQLSEKVILSQLEKGSLGEITSHFRNNLVKLALEENLSDVLLKEIQVSRKLNRHKRCYTNKRNTNSSNSSNSSNNNLFAKFRSFIAKVKATEETKTQSEETKPQDYSI